jgi:hypothetical protein
MDTATSTDATATNTSNLGDAGSGTAIVKESGVTVDKSAADTGADVSASAAIEGSGDAEVVETQAPATDENGFALEGSYPANRRLRAERLFDDGEDEDPDGVLTPEDIAAAGERITRARSAEEAANPPLAANMKVKAIEKIAKAQGVDISSAANNEERVRLINEARAAGTARPANEEVR